ncbi:MAG TPA: MFS transporter [Symbiobacteriaceae bacterium]|nr:MFS transporter [Symbiobacteriaceae bacterium]
MAEVKGSRLIQGLLVGGQGVTTLAENVMNFGFSLYVLQLTGAALHVGLVQVVTLIPHMLGLIWGVLIDRWPRRPLLVGLLVVRMLLALAIPLALKVHISAAYLLLFLGATASSLFNSTRLAFMPDAVSKEELAVVNAVDQTVEPLAMTLGMVSAGLLVKFLPLTELFVACATAFGLGALCYWFIRTAKPAPAAQAANSSIGVGQVIRDIGSAWTVILKRPPLAYYVPGVTGTYVGMGIFSGLLLVFAMKTMMLDEVQAGLLQSATVIGATVAGIVLVPYVKRMTRGLMVVVGFAGLGACLAVMSLSHSLVWAAVALLLAGCFNIVSYVGGRLLIQESTPAEMRGRVFSAKFALAKPFNALGGLTAGFLTDRAYVSVPGMMMIAALLILGTGLAGLLVPALRVEGGHLVETDARPGA